MMDEDRRLDTLLERIDLLRHELEVIGRRLDGLEGLNRIAEELHDLNGSAAGARLRGARPPRARRPPQGLTCASVERDAALGDGQGQRTATEAGQRAGNRLPRPRLAPDEHRGTGARQRRSEGR